MVALAQEPAPAPPLKQGEEKRCFTKTATNRIYPSPYQGEARWGYFELARRTHPNPLSTTPSTGEVGRGCATYSD